jgi:hypothetical protein
MTAIRGKPIERQIEVYEEEWKRDNHEAVRCGDLEEVLAVGIGIYSALEHVNAIWRANVSRGIDEYQTADDQGIRRMFERWLGVCERAVPQVARCEERFGKPASWRRYSRAARLGCALHPGRYRRPARGNSSAPTAA